MVNPMLLVALFLFAAFLTALADKLHRRASLGLMYLALTAGLGLSLYQLLTNLLHPELAPIVFSSGFPAPLSISLRLGIPEAALLSLVNFIGLLGATHLAREMKEQGAQAIALYLLTLLGATGLILTRDIFNSFVFLEILSISTYALIGIRQDRHSLAGGLKYMFAGGVASSFYLIGIVMAYRYSGTLNLDAWLGGAVPQGAGYQVAVFLLAIGLFLELKPFPANGWALDLYQSAHGGIGALVSTVHVGATLYLFAKLMPAFGPAMIQLFTVAGLVSFVFSNLVGLRQTDVKRLLGYSSTAQAGLVVFALGAMQQLRVPPQTALLVAFGLFLANALAKSGLFWLTEVVKEKLLKDWGLIRRDGALLVAMAVAVFALMAVPPFPSFFAKWELVRLFTGSGSWFWLSGLLLGSVFEAAYLLRWLGWAVRGETAGDFEFPATKIASVLGSAVVLFGAGIPLFFQHPGAFPLSLLPVVALVVMALLDWLPVKVKGFAALALLGVWVWQFLLPELSGIKLLFGLVLVGGSLVQVFGFMHRKGRAEGIFPLLAMLIVSLGGILVARTPLEFFLGWEFMTFSSYLMALRGGKARIPAFTYAMFSTVGAYLVMVGLNLLPMPLAAITPAGAALTRTAGLLLAFGFLIKTGAFGVHYWLPGVYSESEDDTTSLFSSVLSKAGVYGLVLVLTMLAGQVGGDDLSMKLLGWLGILTAFFGALMALFQEDAKYLLAYSSMSQLGYIVAGLSLMSHLGWVSALYLAVTHLLFKGLIFMAMAGVFLRTGTRNMYEMGGLIKKMPIAYISVLMGIIAVSGVPPLTGFGSKWFIYASLLEQGRYLETALAFFASAVAFLYLYKLIHTVFLGQPKPQYAQVKEAPVWLIIPQGIFIMLIMAFSMLPNLLTKPISSVVETVFAKPEWLSWSGYTISMGSSNLSGYWNGNLVMFVTMGVFMVPLIWLMLVLGKTQKVKQFNIVFAAERPYKPWTTHFAYNMFAHYNKALGFLAKPRATRFYNGLAEGFHSVAATISRLYTGNGQTYLLHLLLYTIILYLFLGVTP